MLDVTGSLCGRRILVVEDDYILAMDVVHMLRRSGADVVGPWPCVTDALACLDAGGRGIDAAVLDVVLRGGERVYPVADRLDARGIPFLFTTGSSPDMENPAFADRPNLAKPITTRVLVRALEQIMGRASQPRRQDAAAA